MRNHLWDEPTQQLTYEYLADRIIMYKSATQNNYSYCLGSNNDCLLSLKSIGLCYSLLLHISQSPTLTTRQSLISRHLVWFLCYHLPYNISTIKQSPLAIKDVCMYDFETSTLKTIISKLYSEIIKSKTVYLTVWQTKIKYIVQTNIACKLQYALMYWRENIDNK